MITTTVQYTTHISIFLIAGLIGTILGHMIKTGIKRWEQLTATMQDRGGFKGVAAALWELTGADLTGLITVLLIGFGALLILAKDGVPVSGWDQAIGLGIGLAVLTDDELLTKFGGSR